MLQDGAILRYSSSSILTIWSIVWQCRLNQAFLGRMVSHRLRKKKKPKGIVKT